MTNIIVALPKLEDAKNIKNVLVRSGFRVTSVCTTGAQAISQADAVHDGIILCSYKLPDMIYTELQECLPQGCELLVMASQRFLQECYGSGVVCLSMPFQVRDLVNTVQMLSENMERRRRKQRMQPKKRSQEEEDTIREAKELLMARNHMTEEEAHKYLQKCSMDSGTNIVETAQMVLLLQE